MRLIGTRLSLQLSTFLALGTASSIVLAQNDIVPPTLGQSTKGTPAVSETVSAPTAPAGDAAATSTTGADKYRELRRESGQRYLIELQSGGTTQYIEETDSDGNIESAGKSNNIEDTPNLPKWRIGSW